MIIDNIKKMVLELRENGKSYSEISNILEKEHGIRRTRQSVWALYNREKRKQDIIDVEDRNILVYSVLGYSAEEIKVLSDSKLSIADIQRIIDSNYKEIDNIYNNLVSNVEKTIKRHQKVSRITYEGSLIKQSVFNKILDDAGLGYIKNKIKSGIGDIRRYAGVDMTDRINSKLLEVLGESI